MIGSKLGPYEITAKLGEGGMGEVWRAKDFHLGREVALKVLPEAFTADPERTARFEREAKLLAQLNHPNIAQIHGLEVQGETRALVMELVEGPTLAERLEAGSLPLEESLSIARQIAEALEEAHEKGIVHRDLKPQNIKASIEGKVKVLDFGLAKAMDPMGTASGAGSASQLAASPTLTLGATIQGVILGTAAYMSPEQAKGLAVDKRADTWAFGVVLYEMLTGGRLFDAPTVPETLALVLTRTPDLDELPSSTPPAIRRLLRRCLQRNPKQRLHAIADARIVIDETLSGESEEPGSAVAEPTPARATRPAWQAALALVAAVVVGALGVAALGTRRADSETVPRIVSEIRLPAGQVRSAFTPPVLSPDRTRLALVLIETESETRRIWLRNLATGDFRPVPGTEGAARPFWSPDSRSLGYWVDGQIVRLDLEGGRPVPLAKANFVCGATWGTDYIVYCASIHDALRRIRPSGGESEPTTPKPEGTLAVNPIFLPDGKRFLFVAPPSDPKQGIMQLLLGATDGSPPRPLLAADSGGWYDGSHLFYLRGETLLARPFDARGGSLGAGDPRIVAEGVYSQRGGQFSVVGGIAVYAPPSPGTRQRIVVYERTGNRRETIEADGPLSDLVLSPDGRMAAVRKADPELDRSGNWVEDVWLVDLARKVFTRATFGGDDDDPIFSPDGTEIVYSHRGDLLRAPANGTGEPAPLAASENDLVPCDWTADGWIVYASRDDDQSDLYAIRAAGGEPKPLLSTPYREMHARVSPDGRWLAFVSDESGGAQVYVTRWPDLAGKWRVSNESSAMPIWGRDGSELYFMTAAERIARTSFVVRGGVPEIGLAEELFPISLSGTYTATTHRWAIAPDGARVYVLEDFQIAEDDGPDLVLITNPLGKTASEER